ncbi:DinB family protein [Solihabitans fulvus]|uniref:DinB family protein n=1 Tax=Solihabitans fulvus TaxID=1892852 RepID=A0A5B2XHN8_9PSEU|nr:DinB family protein [Solihabitans fulvus]KAA2262555.1 DinB family protein [Solihabitans fulvus]
MTQDLITEPPVAGNELDTLLGTLERNRRVLEWKCADLDAAAMATTVGTSAITLGGLLRHLVRVEQSSFEWKLHGRVPQPVWSAEDWDSDWVWTAADDPDAVWRDWRAAVERSRGLIAEAMADGGLDRARGQEFPGWGVPSLRRLLVDMIEEYARHSGHADLIREAIDGRVGEDAPR